MANRKPNRTTSSKQSAAARRTKKTSTPIKKAPPRKSATETVKSGNSKPAKTAVISQKTAKTVTKAAISGKKTARQPKGRHKNLIRLVETAESAKFTDMGEKVKNGEIIWSHYAIDGNVGYHYYEVL